MKLTKSLKVFAVRRLWCHKHDMLITTKIITTGPWKQKLLFEMTIPKNTPYGISNLVEEIEYIFTFGNIKILVYMGDK